MITFYIFFSNFISSVCLFPPGEVPFIEIDYDWSKSSSENEEEIGEGNKMRYLTSTTRHHHHQHLHTQNKWKSAVNKLRHQNRLRRQLRSKRLEIKGKLFRNQQINKTPTNEFEIMSYTSIVNNNRVSLL